MTRTVILDIGFSSYVLTNGKRPYMSLFIVLFIVSIYSFISIYYY
ncbi:protein of unknown function [Shewanella benthica]|uniref:Uncharacterized protein n=1 Tax=Shewanella benthica TaxID=43661 RepID=A0A330LYT3_9GAMM|nr:protein of unknown function [Shewanella benthica]